MFNNTVDDDVTNSALVCVRLTTPTRLSMITCTIGDPLLHLHQHCTPANNTARARMLAQYAHRALAPGRLVQRQPYFIHHHTIAARCQMFMYLNLMLLRNAVLANPRALEFYDVPGDMQMLLRLPRDMWWIIVTYAVDVRLQCLYAMQLVSNRKTTLKWVIMRSCSSIYPPRTCEFTHRIHHDDQHCQHYQNTQTPICPAKLLTCEASCSSALHVPSWKRHPHTIGHLRAIAFMFVDTLAAKRCRRVMKYMEKQHTELCIMQATRRGLSFAVYNRVVRSRHIMPAPMTHAWYGHAFHVTAGNLSAIQRILWPISMPLYVNQSPPVLMCTAVRAAHKCDGRVMSCVVTTEHVLRQYTAPHGPMWHQTYHSRRHILNSVVEHHRVHTLHCDTVDIAITAYADGHIGMMNHRNTWMPAVVCMSTMDDMCGAHFYRRRKSAQEPWASQSRTVNNSLFITTSMFTYTEHDSRPQKRMRLLTGD